MSLICDICFYQRFCDIDECGLDLFDCVHDCPKFLLKEEVKNAKNKKFSY